MWSELTRANKDEKPTPSQHFSVTQYLTRTNSALVEVCTSVLKHTWYSILVGLCKRDLTHWKNHKITNHSGARDFPFLRKQPVDSKKDQAVQWTDTERHE